MARSVTFHSILLVGTGSLLAASGCQTAKKVTGTRFVHFSASPDQVVEAAKGAMESLDLRMVNATSTKVDGRIQARTAQGKDVTIQVNREDEGVSKVSIKVGTLGDETITNAIIDETRKRLESE